MMSQNPTAAESLPWYRYAMVWLVILLPLSVVIASIFTIVLAHKNAPVILTSEISVNKAEPAGKVRSAVKSVAPATN